MYSTRICLDMPTKKAASAKLTAKLESFNLESLGSLWPIFVLRCVQALTAFCVGSLAAGAVLPT